MQMISSIEKLTNALIIIPFTFQVHSGSYIRSLFYGLSSVVVMFSLVCHVFAVAYLDASSNCGPFKGMERIRCVYDRERCFSLSSVRNEFKYLGLIWSLTQFYSLSSVHFRMIILTVCPGTLALKDKLIRLGSRVHSTYA